MKTIITWRNLLSQSPIDSEMDLVNITGDDSANDHIDEEIMRCSALSFILEQFPELEEYLENNGY